MNETGKKIQSKQQSEFLVACAEKEIDQFRHATQVFQPVSVSLGCLSAFLADYSAMCGSSRSLVLVAVPFRASCALFPPCFLQRVFVFSLSV
jgi:hypothetical protein